MQFFIEKRQQPILIACRQLFITVFCLWLSAAGSAYAFTVSDSGGHKLNFSSPPTRIVSLVPGVTEIIAELKADQALVGITYHSTRPARLSRCMVVGGFMAPSLKRIKALKPDLVFISSMHENLRSQLETSACRVVEVSTSSLAAAYANIKLVGKIVGKKLEAVQLVEDLQRQLALISRKVERIPSAQRRRVMLVMECLNFMVPGDDSFHNELIAAAGGIPPRWGENGVAVNVDAAAVRVFDPQFIYANGSCKQKVRELFAEPAWAEVAAVKNKSIFFFPDALTDRPAIHMPDFVAWLAATIYADYFSRPENIVLRDDVRARRGLDLKIDYVKSAEVVETTIIDFTHRTLVVDLAEPMLVLSTLEGLRPQITTVANHYLPPTSWGLIHKLGNKEFERRVASLLERKPETTSMLFTGANMDNLAHKRVSFKEMQVTALVTAGVSSNAVRMGAEAGRYYELEDSGPADKPGTINIILLSNLRLTPKAMIRAIISACEGKSAALQDLDIRSSSNPAFLQATGTGTDNIMVVEGRGRTVNNTGGHSKMGELIARAVYDGVLEAVRRQNAIHAKRSIFQRLQERHIAVYEFIKECRLKKGASSETLLAPVEGLLLEPRYAAFVESSLALSDAWQRGQIVNLESFRQRCLQVASEIAGRSLQTLPQIYYGLELPDPLRLALESLVHGVINRR